MSAVATIGQRAWARLLNALLRIGETLIRHGARDGRQAYFDPALHPWSRELESGWREIRAELDAVLQDPKGVHPFQVVSEEQRAITDDDRWRVFVFHVYGTPIEANCRRCPRTAALLARIPRLRNAMFSILAPGKHIAPHRGIYNGLLRFHLALKVPQPAQSCVLEVNGEQRHWTEGRTVLFDDSFVHSVRNDTDQVRVVLFGDLERPLRWPLATMNRWLCAVLASSRVFRVPIEEFERGEL
jgi:beta-hydroxylase